jgi:hypothetical protein
MQTVLTSVADQAARATRFVQRRSKMTGAKFAQTLVFGWLDDPQATYDQLAQTAAALGVSISPQGLEERFTPEAAAYLQQVLEAAVHQVITADPVVIPLLRRFNGVYLQDSTTIVLPDALAPLWSGSGGSTPAGTSAALKAQVQVNVSTGQLTHLDLQPGRAQDKTAPMQTAPLPAGSLRIADLGYFAVPVLAAHQARGGYWLSRYHPQTLVFTVDGQPLDLVTFLQGQRGDTVDQAIQLTQQHRLLCRLVAQRVPSPVAAERRRKLKAELRREGRTPSAKQLALLDWAIFVTNVPSTLLSVTEVLVLGRVRWQIELVFKLWKSHGQIDESRSDKPYRILCEVYAKLLALLIQHWIVITSCWQYPNRSLFKAAKTVRQHAVALAEALGSAERLQEELSSIQRCLSSGARLNSRQAAPNTYQLMLACSPGGLA